MQRKIIPIISIIIIFLFSSVVMNGDSRPLWEKFGQKYKNKYPGDGGKKAIYLAGLVGEALYENKVDPNYDHPGRARALLKHGDQKAGTCGDIADIMRNVFKGAGFEKHQIFKIVVRREGFNKYKGGWLFDNNIEHTVFGVVVNGKPIIFELWAYGGENGSFKDFYKHMWNGMDLDVWLQIMKQYKYTTYSYGDEKFKPINRNNIDIFLRKEELVNSGRAKRTPEKMGKNIPIDEVTRIENEFRALYPLWIKKNDYSGGKTTVTSNAVKVEPNKYRVACETKRIAEHGRLKGKEYVSGSVDIFMTLGELKAAVKFYKEKLGIK